MLAVSLEAHGSDSSSVLQQQLEKVRFMGTETKLKLLIKGC